MPAHIQAGGAVKPAPINIGTVQPDFAQTLRLAAGLVVPAAGYFEMLAKLFVGNDDHRVVLLIVVCDLVEGNRGGYWAI